jgi:hypothetical protein
LKKITLKGEFETDEVCITDWHKGHPEVIERLELEKRRENRAANVEKAL